MSVRLRNILISEPSPWDMTAFKYLPYVWGILKTHCERNDAALAAEFRWLDPIFLHGDVGPLIAPYEGQTIDVLGLSCYTWNWKLQCQIARAIKGRHPGCLVVAGGPEPDYKDKDFFRSHPYIDMVAVKDGEVTFASILARVAGDDRDFSDIGGLYLPGADAHVCTGPAVVPQVFDESPYLRQSGSYEALIRKHGGLFNATWETNRGCPYSCSFCDWGSNTMSKLRRFDMERVEAEIAWFGRMKIAILFLADANFGMLPRDLDITDRVTETYARYGHPLYLSYNNAKNNPDRSVAISKKLLDAGLTSKYELAIQHTREEVLAATNRQSISADKQVQVVKQLMVNGVAVDVQLILGIPGDTRALWRSCLGDLMEWGIHAYYLVFLYHLLPNAPAAAPEFVARWEIETVRRYVFTFSSNKRLRGPIDPKMARNRIIVSSKSYSRDDWVMMNVYAGFTKALHNCGLTQMIARYLRFTHDVAYEDFYRAFIEDLCAEVEPAKSWFQAVAAHYREFLESEDAIEFMDVEALPDYPYQVSPFQWIYVQACLQLDDFYDAAREFLVARYPAVRRIASLVDYQRNMVILPSYVHHAGKAFDTDLNWPLYFQQAKGHLAGTALEDVSEAINSVVCVTDKTCTDGMALYPLDWSSLPEGERFAVWFDRTVENHSCETRSNFQEVRIRGKAPLSA